MNASARKSDVSIATIAPNLQAGAAERARILDAINTADDLMSTALVEAFRMTARFGRTSKEEVATHFTRCNNPGVYSSWFNLGAKATDAVGLTAALQAIDGAEASGKGAAFNRCRDALQTVTKAAKMATGGAKPTAKQAKAIVATAVEAAVEKSAERKTAAKKGARGPNSATLSAAASTCTTPESMAAFVLTAANGANRIEEPEGHGAAWRKAVKALQDAAEAFAPFRRK